MIISFSQKLLIAQSISFSSGNTLVSGTKKTAPKKKRGPASSWTKYEGRAAENLTKVHAVLTALKDAGLPALRLFAPTKSTSGQRARKGYVDNNTLRRFLTGSKPNESFFLQGQSCIVEKTRETLEKLNLLNSPQEAVRFYQAQLQSDEKAKRAQKTKDAANNRTTPSFKITIALLEACKRYRVSFKSLLTREMLFNNRDAIKMSERSSTGIGSIVTLCERVRAYLVTKGIKSPQQCDRFAKEVSKTNPTLKIGATNIKIGPRLADCGILEPSSFQLLVDAAKAEIAQQECGPALKTLKGIGESSNSVIQDSLIRLLSILYGRKHLGRLTGHLLSQRFSHDILLAEAQEAIPDTVRCFRFTASDASDNAARGNFHNALKLRVRNRLTALASSACGLTVDQYHLVGAVKKLLEQHVQQGKPEPTIPEIRRQLMASRSWLSISEDSVSRVIGFVKQETRKQDLANLEKKAPLTIQPAVKIEEVSILQKEDTIEAIQKRFNFSKLEAKLFRSIYLDSSSFDPDNPENLKPFATPATPLPKIRSTYKSMMDKLRRSTPQEMADLLGA